MEVAYDLHVHSCLSPCGDDDMTPANIAGMAALKGLSVVALTDHNSAKNCPAFFKACEEVGVLPIPGMELTTAEDIHLVALFKTLAEAMAFDTWLQDIRVRIPNRVDIFGRQQIMDENDNVIGEEPDLLINALSYDIESLVTEARAHGALCYPAHVDKEANGILATLGFLPEEPKFSVFEVHDAEKIPAYLGTHLPGGAKTVTSSDAHYLWDIREAEEAGRMEIPEELTGDEARAWILGSLL